jgi:hypothetical protein
MEFCKRSGAFRQCAKEAGDDCATLNMCAFRGGAIEQCPGGGGVPAGSAGCNATTDCQYSCGANGPCNCACLAKASPSAVLPLLNNALCWDQYCADCKDPSSGCGQCWEQHCKARWERECKGR